MGIRKEIEKLRSPYKNPHFNKIYDRALNNALYILDKWELVEEITCQEGQINLEAFGKPFARLMKTSRVGDTIAIYRRKR